jgi:AraC-like DNA-binding protein
MKLLIKNMVCDRCTLAVRNVLRDLGIELAIVNMGEVDFGESGPDDDTVALFRERIEELGFELISDRKSELIENMKKYIIALVNEPADGEKVKLSAYLSKRLFHDYTYLSNLFSSVEGVTIEQYHIHQKIEKAKELLVYDELTLTEIAFRLGYSSVAHLSRQFKKVTGQTPTAFKRIRDSGLRKPLDKV